MDEAVYSHDGRDVFPIHWILFAVSAVSVAFSLLLFTFFAKRLLKNKGHRPLNTGTLPSETN